MEKILIEPEARFRLERLCDSKHPQEVGGYFLGSQIEEDVLIQDIFPVPNTSDFKNRQYKEHNWGDHWTSLYGKTVALKALGRFHSHPNGSIPSEGDMKSCRGLNIWVIHHGRGQHTFSGSRDFKNREVLLLNEKREVITRPHFVGDSFHLSTPIIDRDGRLELDNYSKAVLTLKDETRKMLMLSLKHADPSNRVNLKRVVEESGRTKTTVRKHLGVCLKKGLLESHWRRGEYVINYDNLNR